MLTAVGSWVALAPEARPPLGESEDTQTIARWEVISRTPCSVNMLCCANMDAFGLDPNH